MRNQISSIYSSCFATLALCFLAMGVTLCFVFPPFQVADEDLHWTTATDRAERVLHRLKRRDYADCTALSTLPTRFAFGPTKNSLDIKHPQGELKLIEEHVPGCHGRPEIPYGTALTYPGVLLARLVIADELNSPTAALNTLYLSRVLQGLGLVMLLLRGLWFLRATPLKIAPGLLTAGAFCLSPMFLSQSFGVTSDTIVQLFSLSLILAILFWGRLTLIDKAVFIVSGVVACVTKPVIMPLALAGVVYCYLCSRCFAGGDTASDNLGSAPNHQGRFTLLAALAFIVVTALFMYYGQVKKLEQLENLSGRDLDYNLKFLLADWPRAFQILWSSSWHYLALDKMTSPLGWTNVMISAETTAYWKSLLCTAFGVDLLLAAGILWQQVRRRGWATLLRHSAIALGLWILLLVGLFGFNIANALALYIHWSPRDAMGVAGLQNRYFLPFFLVLLASIPSALVRPLRFAKQEGTQPAESRQSVTLTLLAICVSLALILPYCGLVLIEVLTRYY